MVSSLKSKLIVLSTLFLLVLYTNCTEDTSAKKSQAIDSTACSETPQLNPNGDSELAILMRKMMLRSESLKEMVKKGTLPKEFPEEFIKIHTAQPTDSETKKASFDGFATNYLSNMKILFASPIEERIKNYNAVINACVTCHSEHCPGPLKVINKLKIE